MEDQYKLREGVHYDYAGNILKRGGLGTRIKNEWRHNPSRTAGIAIMSAAALGITSLITASYALDWARENNMNPRFFKTQASKDALYAISKNEFDELAAQPLRDNIASNLIRHTDHFPHPTSKPSIEEMLEVIKKDGFRPESKPVVSQKRDINYRFENIAIPHLVEYVRQLEANGINFEKMTPAINWAQRFVKYDYMSERLDIASKKAPELFAKRLPGYYDQTLDESVAKLSSALQIPLADMPKLIYVNNVMQRVQDKHEQSFIGLRLNGSLKNSKKYNDALQQLMQTLQVKDQMLPLDKYFKERK